MPRLLLHSYLLVHWFSGQRSGIYFVDSTKLAVCHNAQGRQRKVFRRMAQWGRSPMGWFFGLKLHLFINSQGQIMALRITTANVHDRHHLAVLTAGPQGKMFGDKGYLHLHGDDATALAARPALDHWHRGDIKNHLMPLMDKFLLRKRFIIETLLVKLKSHMRLKNTRHRLPSNALVHIFSCIAAYTIAQPKVNMGLGACPIWLSLIHNSRYIVFSSPEIGANSIIPHNQVHGELISLTRICNNSKSECFRRLYINSWVLSLFPVA